jgi:uncharacterized membrane-anchored protein
MTHLPPDHPERAVLAAEVHARPYEALCTPERASSIAVLVDEEARGRELAHIAALCERFGAAPPGPDATHISVPLGPSLRFKWERHGEFSSYTLFMPGCSQQPFSEPASSFVPADRLAAIPGRTLYAAHAELIAAGGETPDPAASSGPFDGNMVAGGAIGGGAAIAYTDFHVRADGYARFLVLDRSLTPRQAGRMQQRLVEIDGYRMMALLALPIARRLSPQLLAMERALAALTEHIGRNEGTDEKLLGELTRLAADVESALAASQYRFGASRAYYELVRSRIAELRERRLPGIQTIDEFMTRRLAPAMATCASVSQRLRDLSERVAQASGLLSTRVEIAREQQNQALLASMNRRARLQLRLQQTVEGLSVAAVSYYVVGLVGYGAKALKAGGLRIDPDLAAGAAIPIVVLLVAWAMRRVRHKLDEPAVATPPKRTGGPRR